MELLPTLFTTILVGLKQPRFLNIILIYKVNKFKAGFNGGEGTKYYALPTSGTDKIMYLEEFGNTGIPGNFFVGL